MNEPIWVRVLPRFRAGRSPMGVAFSEPRKRGRIDEPFSVAFLSLKGGGQEGVGAASPDSPRGRRKRACLVDPPKLSRSSFPYGARSWPIHGALPAAQT